MTILSGQEVARAHGCIVDDAILLVPDEAGVVLGWQRKVEGWCRGDLCVPAFAAAPYEVGDAITLAGFASLTGRLAVEDPTEAVAALVTSPDRAVDAIHDAALDFELLDRTGASFDLRALLGHKVLLVFWASWCGCRYDLPAWEAEYRTLAPHGLRLASIAVDPDPRDAHEFIDAAAPTHHALIDASGLAAARFDIINVPTVMWIGEDGRVARPPDTQTATDAMRQFNGLDSAAALRALRRWVLEDDSGLTASDVERHLRAPTVEGQQARAHASIGLYLIAECRHNAGQRHLARAAALAPENVAIRRGTLRARGMEPFGQDYFDLRDELDRRGIAIYRPLPDWQAR